MAMTLRLDAVTDELLEKLAETQHISKHEAALRAIRDSYQQAAHRRQVESLTDEVMAEHGDLLKRLGE